MKVRIKLKTGDIIELDMEEYLRGVVPAEMPPYYPIEALKAQAIAARTYAMHRINPDRPYDLAATVANQVYDPEKTHPRTDFAIKLTEGMYLSYGGKAIDAVFSATNGGTIRSAKERWGNDVPYLIEKPDPYCNLPLGNSHGVGLCQRGAGAMAEQGFSAKEILCHYYHGIEIEGAPAMERFAATAMQFVGKSVYVLGGNGETLTDMADPVAWIKSKETDSADADRAIAYYKGLLASGLTEIHAFDCSGLVYHTLKQLFPTAMDMTADGYLAMCEQISSSALTDGDLLFRTQNGHAYHVGIYAGGNVIHSKGRDCGVVCEQITDLGDTHWNTFGRLKMIWEEDVIPIILTVQKPMLQGEAIRAFQKGLESLGYDIGKTGADGKWGKNSHSALEQFIANQHNSTSPANAYVQLKLGDELYTGTVSRKRGF